MAKLTLRDLFWLVTLAVVLVAWWVDRSRLARERDQIRIWCGILETRLHDRND
jgi:hypothetical protein